MRLYTHAQCGDNFPSRGNIYITRTAQYGASSTCLSRQGAPFTGSRVITPPIDHDNEKDPLQLSL